MGSSLPPPPASRLLIIAGSDSGGGAGIQADIKTATAFGCYSATAITAITAQNTEGVFGIHEVPEAFIVQQMRLVLADIGADAIKTGMLHKAGVIKAVADELVNWSGNIPLVVDPVMVAKGGTPLLEQNAVEALRQLLLPMATVITPNIPEAELLTGIRITDADGMEKAGKKLLESGARSVLMKGGHLKGDVITDVLVTMDSVEHFNGPRIATRHTHGTGCTLASAIASRLAQQATLREAVIDARNYVRHAIETAPDFGKGHGPLNHLA